MNIDVVEDGVCGYLADNPDEWLEKLLILVNSDNLRKNMGLRGRQKIVENYSLIRWIKDFEETIIEVK